MSRRGRPPKSLIAHVEDATFIPCRHSALLARESLPVSAPQALRDLQAFYRSTGSQRLRAALAVEFAEAVRSGSAGRRLTDAQSILAQVGLMQLWGSTSADQWFALEAASEAWDAEHGARWRRLHDAALPDDPDDEGDAMSIIGGEEPPDPPGWHLLSASG